MIFLPYLFLKTTLEDYSFMALEYLIKRSLHKTAHISQRKHKTCPVLEICIALVLQGLCSCWLGRREGLMVSPVASVGGRFI